jgi:phage-related protein
MAEQQVKVVITGKDDTGQAFNSVKNRLGGMQVSVGSLVKTIAGLAIVKEAGEFLYNMGKGAAEAETSLARVTATLTAMGPEALRNKNAIVEMSQAAVKLGFDDEAAAESITRFYQATNSLTDAQTLNSLAMDLARAKNIDLATAAGLVNQVLAGNGRALKAYQIDLKESATPLEALGELHEKVKGQSEAFSHTFEGQMLTLNESFNNLKDTIGAALLEAITPFIKDFATWAADPAVVNQTKAIAKGIGDLAKTVIPPVIEAVKLMYEGFMIYYNALVDVEVQIFKVIDALSAMATKAKSAAATVGDTLKSGPSGIASGAVSQLKYMITGRAAGGPVSGGTPYVVGENGPELFVPNNSGAIMPNGGGSTINIINPVLLDDTMIAKLSTQIARTLGRDLRY